MAVEVEGVAEVSRLAEARGAVVEEGVNNCQMDCKAMSDRLAGRSDLVSRKD